jgi:hypothetical protein
VEEALTKVMSWEFYFRVPNDLPAHAPSIRTAVRKFVSKISRVEPRAGRYRKVKEDWGHKLARFIDPKSIPVAGEGRGYGLEPAGPVKIHGRRWDPDRGFVTILG